jgi:hypothetical protein
MYGGLIYETVLFLMFNPSVCAHDLAASRRTVLNTSPLDTYYKNYGGRGASLYPASLDIAPYYYAHNRVQSERSYGQTPFKWFQNYFVSENLRNFK